MRKKGTFWTILGSALLISALLLLLYNLYEGFRAQKESAFVSENMKKQVESNAVQLNDEQSDLEIPAYELYPDMEMPLMEIDGEMYVGYLEIPALELTLPVAGGEWNEAKMKKSPCLYEGTVYKKNMIIVGHNYRSHFSGLKKLPLDTEIIFIDAEGNRFEYRLAWTEVIDEMDTESMLAGEEEWDLTLFTCTYGGRQRYTLRCIQE